MIYNDVTIAASSPAVQAFMKDHNEFNAWFNSTGHVVSNSSSHCIEFVTSNYQDVAALLERVSVDHVEASQEAIIDDKTGVAGKDKLSAAFPAKAALFQLPMKKEIWPLIQMISVQVPRSCASSSFPSNVTLLDTMGTTDADLASIEIAMKTVFACRKPSQIWLVIAQERVRGDLSNLTALRTTVRMMCGHTTPLTVIMTKIDEQPENTKGAGDMVQKAFPTIPRIPVSSLVYSMIHNHDEGEVKAKRKRRTAVANQYDVSEVDQLTMEHSGMIGLYESISALSNISVDECWKLVATCYRTIEANIVDYFQSLNQQHQQNEQIIATINAFKANIGTIAEQTSFENLTQQYLQISSLHLTIVFHLLLSLNRN